MAESLRRELRINQGSNVDGVVAGVAAVDGKILSDYRRKRMMIVNVGKNCWILAGTGSFHE